jgi:hypothetical protein
MNTAKLKGFVAAVIVTTMISAPSTAAVPDDYIGSWQVTAYGDHNITDGIALQTYNLSVSFAPSSDPERDLNFNLLDTNSGGTLNTTLNVDSVGAARIAQQDVPWPGMWPEFSTGLRDAVVITQGNGMAMGVVSQDPTDRNQTGFLYSLWEKSPVTTVTRDDFLGVWETTQAFSNRNLISDPEISPRSQYFACTITAGSSPDTILVDYDYPGYEAIELQLEGNHAFLNAPFDVGNNYDLAFDLLHDGETIQFATIGQEYYDLTDLSLRIGTMSPVPLPAALWFFLSGAGAFGILVSRNGKANRGV